MLQFFHDLITYPFQQDKTNNKVNQLFTALFKEFPALFRIKPTFKKLFIPLLLIWHYVFRNNQKK
ncbi:MAG: hypothetical protein LBG52_03885 [Candidatus Peribacteria bacterium]|nr:hypothetical protein [Candidatus Peribacteria bacterium]